MRVQRAFQNEMTHTQTVLGWIYLGLHVLALPILLPLLNSVLQRPMTDGTVNLIYYALGWVFLACAMLSYLRRSFDTLLDDLRTGIRAVLIGAAIYYVLGGAVSMLLLALEDVVVENPNNAAVMDAAATEYGKMKAVTVFLAPLVEEVLFRGVVFGSLRRRSRPWAYVVSIAVFSLYHVWQYALIFGDARLLLYALQYIPVSVALTWIYERSGSIWSSTFFHMGFNAVSMYVMELLEQML